MMYGGGVEAGQSPVPPPAAGQVRRSRSPPEFVIANSIPIEEYAVRIASVVTSPTSDSQSRPSTRPQTSERRISTVDSPILRPRIGLSWSFRSSTFAWIVGSGVTPMFHGLWKSAVL